MRPGAVSKADRLITESVANGRRSGEKHRLKMREEEVGIGSGSEQERAASRQKEWKGIKPLYTMGQRPGGRMVSVSDERKGGLNVPRDGGQGPLPAKSMCRIAELPIPTIVSSEPYPTYSPFRKSTTNRCDLWCM